MDVIEIQLVAKRYQLLEKLGVGGMGAVFRAYDRLMGRVVALKQVTTPAENLLYSTRATLDVDVADFRLALAEEFKTLASLRHPNIVSVLDYGFDSPENSAVRQPFFTMELVPEPRTLLEAAQDQAPAARIHLLIQVLQALAYLHRRGIIHRDLKPGNVLVTGEQVKVVDFGLAVANEGESGTAGTLVYIAPEVLRTLPVTPAADLYAVGVMAYEMFAGYHPFDRYENKGVDELLRDILFAQPNLSTLDCEESVAAVIGRLLLKDADERYQSAHDVIAALSTAIGVSLPADNAAIRESFLQAAQFVGRQTELRTLLGGLGQIIQPNSGPGGSVWLISGESGVGKSRLLEELRRYALVDGALVLRGQGVSEGALPYQLWREPLRRLVLSTELSDLEASVLLEFVPDAADLLGREVSPAPELDPAAAQQRAFALIADLFRRQTQPILLILEDLHWAVESLSVLKSLAYGIAEMRLMIVGSFRDDERPDLAAEISAANTLRLSRLDKNHIAELSMSMLGDSDQLENIVEFIARETEGNAFFIVEVVRALAEEAGQLDLVGSTSLPEKILTGGVRRLLSRRIERVPEAARPLLRLAAVMGRQLDLKLLRAIMAKVDLLQTMFIEEWLDIGLSASVLELQNDGTVEGDWRFAHDKLREGLLEQLLPDEKCTLHQLVAEGIETTYPNASEYTAALYLHWSQAQNPAKEAYYALLAGKQALNVSVYHDALKYFMRGLELSHSDQPELHSLIGETHLLLGQYPQAQQHLEQGLALAQDERLKADVLSWLGQIRLNQGDYVAASQLYEQSLVLARQRDYRVRVAEVLTRLGRLSVYSADYAQAEAYLQEGLRLAESLADTDTMAQAYNNLGITMNLLNDYERAELYHGRSLELARTMTERFPVARSLNNVGEVYRHRGKYEQALASYREAIGILREINHRWGVAAVLDNLGFVSVIVGDYEQAIEDFRECLQIGMEIGASTTNLDVLIGVARLTARLGDPARALEIIGCVRDQQGFNAEMQKKLVPVFDEIRAMLPPFDVEDHLARGKQLSLESIFASVLGD